MKTVLLPLFLFPALFLGAAELTPQAALERMPRTHPRLLLDAAGFDRLKARAAGDEMVAKGVTRLVADAEMLTKRPPDGYKLEGRRLLTSARHSLAFIATSAMAYRLTGRQELLDRAVLELETISAYADWHPSHTLDTAELCAGAALGYDWLYDKLDEPLRTRVHDAIVRFGLEVAAEMIGRKKGWWPRSHGNWNQVCHGGFLAGALAIDDRDLPAARTVLESTIKNMPIAMAAYAPRGAFPEGPMYWGYGTGFNVFALALMESVLGTDFRLSEAPGFAETADYVEAVTAPSGNFFNHSDCSLRRGLSWTVPWFARRFKRPHLLSASYRDVYLDYVNARGNPGNGESVSRFFPMLLAILPTADEMPLGAAYPVPLVYDSGNANRVTVQRSGTGPLATFVGMKGGSPSAPHGHMDGGTFVLEMNGVRWAVELGAEGYTRAEANGPGLWDGRQEGGRWKFYRLGLSGHNTLTLDGCDQQVKAFARLESLTEGPCSTATYDLTPLYTNASRVVRSGEMLQGGGYRLRDRVEGLRLGGTVRWTMHTRAAAERVDDGVLLTDAKTGRRLQLSVTGVKPDWEIVKNPHPSSWDSENRDVTRLTFDVVMPTEGAVDFAVTFAEPAAKARPKAKRDARVAVDRLGMVNKRTKRLWWKERHEEKLSAIRASGGKYDLVFIGDSISHRWEAAGSNVLARLTKRYSVLDLGFGADHTEQVLWRITRGGELDGYEAKVISLMIGTNNSRGYSARNVAAGINKILGEIRARQPQAKIVLTAILPRYGKDEEHAKMRACNDGVNEIIKDFADGETVFWLDMNAKFPPLDGDYKALFPDGTHPNEQGYEIWAAELQPFLDRFVGL